MRRTAMASPGQVGLVRVEAVLGVQFQVDGAGVLLAVRRAADRDDVLHEVAGLLVGVGDHVADRRRHRELRVGGVAVAAEAAPSVECGGHANATRWRLRKRSPVIASQRIGDIVETYQRGLVGATYCGTLTSGYRVVPGQLPDA
jgi:hypothetical protein